MTRQFGHHLHRSESLFECRDTGVALFERLIDKFGLLLDLDFIF